MYDDSKSLFDISNSAPVGNANNKNSPNREGSPPLHSIAKPAAPRDIKEVPTNTNNAYLSIDNRISKVMTTYILEKAGEDVGQHSHNSGELSRAVVERTLQEGLTKAIEAYQGDKPGDNSVIPLFCKVAIISLSEYVAEDFSIFVSRRHLEKVNQLNTQSDTLLTEEEEAQSVQELFTTELSPQRLLSPACLSASNVHNLTMALLDMARKGCDRDADGAVRVHPLLKNRENLFTSSSTTVGTPRHKNDGTSGNGRRAALNALVLSQCIDNITDLLVGDTVDWLFDSLRNGQLVKK
ncbi:hypothetical protein ADEAN_001000900 [Angomonas deanei]|uniref:Uncharacterized protein n=1 Tax=Angomonas deanei TaxID=59799 RepID=A0A7G2CSD4_9TRYP|nr:hypothetical protein ADEAN_001000900 [Angomonas deanei]